MDLKVVISKDNIVLNDAYTVRVKVFVNEQGFRDEFDDIDGYAFHVTAYDGEKVIGCGRFFSETDNNEYHIGRIAVLPEYRGMGIGSAIMSEIEKYCVSMGVRRVVLSAQRRAIIFYEKSGYKSRGEEYLDEGYPHIEMIKNLLD